MKTNMKNKAIINGVSKMNAPKPLSSWVDQLLDDPDGFKPTAPHHLIGPAIKIAANILKIGQDLLNYGKGPRTILLHGPTGAGKTCIANMFSKVMTSKDSALSVIDGAILTKQTVTDWKQQMYYCQSTFQVIHIDEVNFCSQESKNLFLSLFNEVPKKWVFIATTNATPDDSPFWTRWNCYSVQPPTIEEIKTWLETVVRLPSFKADQISKACYRSVRLAQKLAADYIRETRSDNVGKTTK